MNNWGLWLWVSFSLITFFFPFVTHSAFQCFIPRITVDKTVGCRDLAEWSKRILRDKRTVATGQNTSTNETPYLFFSFFALVLFAHFWIAGLFGKVQEKREKTSGFSDGLLPALFLALCVCLSFSLCALVCRGSSESLLYQTEAWPIPAQRENVSSVV